MIRFETGPCVALALCLALSATASVSAEIPYATDAPQPLTPEESVAHFQLPRDLRIEIVASEPLITEPGAMAFDEFGRLYVGELHGYNLEGYYDILELNESGELDLEVRRLHVEGPNLERARNETVGVIKLLEDSDGDGRFETGKVWAENLPPCYGLIRAREGMIAVCPPEIIYLADRDGDGSAEVRSTLFEGFGFELLERGINSPRCGPDNWIYIAAGGGGGMISGPNLSAPVRIGHTDFRIRDDGSAIEPVTGTCATFGLALTDFGNRFGASTNRHALYAVPLEYRHMIRNPYVPSPGGNVDAANYDRIFPTSEPDPWRVARNADPNWVKFYGQREVTPNGFFTAACGPFIYRGGALPPSYVGNHFACDPANNLVHRGELRQEGAGFTVSRAPGEEASEFLTSTDRWFRPINVEPGPDGALYIVDFYREIIEDYSAIPRHLQQRYVESLHAGYKHGRIWRIVAKDAPAANPPTLGTAAIRELVAALARPNPWEREVAQRLLIQRGGEDDRVPVRSLFLESGFDVARLHALYTLDGLEALEAADVERALGDTSHGVRVHALRLAERWLDDEPGIREKALALLGDPHTAVRLQAAQSLGASNAPEVVEGLASAAERSGDERWMSAAIASAAAGRADALLSRLLQFPANPSAIEEIVGLLARTIAAQGDAAKIHEALEYAAEVEGTAAPTLQVAMLDGMAAGLGDGFAQADGAGFTYDGLMRMLASPELPVRDRALHLAGLLQLGDSPVMKRRWEEAVALGQDSTQPVEVRAGAVGMLVAAPWEYQAPLAALLNPREPTEIQLAVVRVFSGANGEDGTSLLLGAFDALTPRVREAVLEVLFSSESRLVSVLDALEAGTLVPASVAGIHRLRLLENGTPAIRARASRVFQGTEDHARSDVIARYLPALDLPRDTTRGRILFGERCAICHRHRGRGEDVGPDLTAVGSRPENALLMDMLDPSGVITAGFAAYLVETEDGGFYSGMLAEETATSITLRRARGESDTILRSQITEVRTSPLSLMPDGLEEGLVPQDLADLIGFLRDTAVSPAPAGVVVFEDEPEFITSLTEGGGAAELTGDKPYSGSACLRITPPQRYSSRMDGWRYRVVEVPATPAEGVIEEIRYLRLAWRTDGDGVMVELADDGAWPPAEDPRRRLFSGSNRTQWEATRITDVAPREWAVVTVDLWKEFGEFTLTGLAPTAMGGPAYFDRIEFLASIDSVISQVSADRVAEPK